MLALVIDDSRAMRRILEHILLDLGSTVVEAADGRQALTDTLSLLGLVPSRATA